MVYFEVNIRNRSRITTSIGDGEFLTAFFSTVWGVLEYKRWGSRFPILMNKLFTGKVDHKDLDILKHEVVTVKEEFKNYASDRVIWDYENLSKKVPSSYYKATTDLYAYFDINGEAQLFNKIFKTIKDAEFFKSDIVVKSSYDDPLF